MPRRIKKYDEAIERYGLDKLKDLRNFFNGKNPPVKKILKYHDQKQKEKKILSAIEANCTRGRKVNVLVKVLKISRPSYYRFLKKHRKDIFSLHR
jgi:hypothetical protein